MLTLKNAMNVGDHLLNEQNGERLVLEMHWTNGYQQFDGVLSHFAASGDQIQSMVLSGFYATFDEVSTYAQEHGFDDSWNVVHYLEAFKSLDLKR